MRAFHADPRLAGIRADHAGNLVATMQLAARFATWSDSDAGHRATMLPTRDRMAAAAGYSLSTWKACRRLLEAWGWIRLVRPGRSETARLKSAQPELHYEGNDAAVYVLAIPRFPRLPRAGRPQKKVPGRLAETASRITRPPSAHRAEPEIVNPGPGVDDGSQEPGRGTALRADSSPKPAAWLALQQPDLPKGISERAALLHWRRFEARGWSMAQWLQAIRQPPNGPPHVIRPSGVRWPASWLKWRLSFWLGPDRKPLPPPHMQAAVRRLGLRLADEERRRERERHRAAEEQRAGAGITARTRAPGTDSAPHAGRIREQMGWADAAPGQGPDPAGAAR
jgi:hypothetical protein